jgi:hypothetical protein
MAGATGTGKFASTAASGDVTGKVRINCNSRRQVLEAHVGTAYGARRTRDHG